MQRAFYIDRLRIILTMLVIFHHTAITFGAIGGWYYFSKPVEGLAQQLLSLCMAVDQSYFMSFFFFLSALLMPDSYERKGFSKFIVDRLIRLGIPLIFYVLIIHPLLVYGIFTYQEQPTGTLFEFVRNMILHHPEPGPMWFVLTLLLFEIGYAMIRHFSKRDYVLPSKGKLPTVLSVVAFMLVSGLAAFVIRLVFPVGKSFFGLQFGYFPLYIGMYIVGVLANRRKWIEQLSPVYVRPWFLVSLVAILAAIVLFPIGMKGGNFESISGGINPLAIFYAMWEPLDCVGFCSFFTCWFSKKFSSRNNLVLAFSSDSYTAYIIHPVILVGFTFLSEQLNVAPLLRFVFVLVVAIPMCFFAARLIRKVHGVKRVL